MRIAYLAWIDTSQESGVLKKISNQITAWRRRGVTVKLFALSPSSDICSYLADIPVEIVKCGRIRAGLVKSSVLFSRLREWKPDVTYYRYLCYFPFLQSLMKEIPTFLEINSNDVTEYKITYPRLIYLYHLLTREWVLKSAVGMFFLTPETTRNYLNYNKPYKIIGDSIDFVKYPVYDAPCNETPRLVFMGLGISPWFGVDKVILMAKIFRDWKFDIIGISKDEFSEELPPNLIAHGRLKQKEYEKILTKADIAIGTLALYRVNMNETTPLKVREYLAYGIPTIIGYKDPDLSEASSFILSLPNSENNVQENLAVIKGFVDQWKGKRVSRSLVSHLDVDIKENQRLEFMMHYSSSIHSE